MELPPGVVEEHGKLYRYVPRTAADGEKWQQRRPVALTLKEAREKRADYYHPTLGWILEGYKLAEDRNPADIMADTSVPVTVPAEGQERPAPAGEPSESEPAAKFEW